MGLDLSLAINNNDYWSELDRFIEINGFDKELIYKCYQFAQKAHSGQTRINNEPFISHPVWEAKVVSQLGIGQEAVMAALLHDCIEKSGVDINDVANNFGDEVALLVNGLTEVKKRTKGNISSQDNIELFRKFLFSSVDDVRVLILRIVDKLHNGMTINYLPHEKQVNFANGVMKIYAPVAEYVGLHFFKKELEDIAFKILHPEDAVKLETMLKERSRDELKALALVKETVSEMLKINNINDFIVEGRIKSLYSTYLKIKSKGIDRIKDRIGIRILTNSVIDCYTILGLLHTKYKYVANEFDDYISSPKPNGYRTIKTTLLWKDRLAVEVQIRTKEMHEFNEFGPASHIAYKTGEKSSVGNGLEWVKDLVKWQKNDKDVNNYRLKVLTNFIYVFTPKGDTIQLPKGSTALDFAYRVHSELGDHCSGIMINNKMSKIDTVLQTGDLIEVLVTKKLNVNKNWLDIVKTNNAKERIRKMVLKDLI